MVDEGNVMGERIVVKYVKIDGQIFAEPVPTFEYETKIGVWQVFIENERQVEALAMRHAQMVDIEVGMQFGRLRDAGKVMLWRSSFPNVPMAVVRIVGSDPMRFVE